MKMSWAHALVLAAATAASGAAMAQENAAPAQTAQAEAGAEQTITAVVERIDRAAGTITVKPGGEFKTPEGWSRGLINEGSMVRITYTTQGEERVATRIRIQAQ